MSEDIKRLRQAFKEGIIVPGRNEQGTLTLKGADQPGFEKLPLGKFLKEAFEERNWTIDPVSLKLVTARRAVLSVPLDEMIDEALEGDGKKPVKNPGKPEKVKKAEPEPEPQPEILPAKPLPPEIELWTESELEEMPWNDLRALAKTYPACEGMTKKAEFIEALVGLPKPVDA
jgi:hypothetical protein